MCSSFSAAAFNILAAAGLLLGGEPGWRFLGMVPPSERLWLHLFALLVVLFGAGYFWVGLDPSRNRVIAALGAAGKLGVFLIGLCHHIWNDTPRKFVMLTSVDLVFALLFLAFLSRTSREAAVNE